MTSTNTFQGLEDSGKPSSRVLRPPGGGSSNIFGGYEDDSSASRRPNKMASTVFAPPEAPQGGPKRSNPPGGKSSGIFTEPEAAFPQHKPLPPGGVTSNIFGGPVSNLPTVKSHPNKPKDNISVGSAVQVRAAAPQPKEEVKKKVLVSPQATPKKEAPPTPEPTATQDSDSSAKQLSEKDHEPHLGARPRSHNRVLNPPGGKSSVVFY
ncbi:jupiter microtubule associated homolog 2 [Silurus meridionalis]|uniref:jupiter microtubule associated homolog 2 n=1 Tax=Silurus meridionalis TaxID=175797 RepID=UPI001EEA22D4|nr:jupiter microtubule associated homolog 2 [Silurus meridionalis]KAI5097238.1 hematological and neurological expressed 1-like protein [Silurus meridionalis]